ncbi:hypothetical protein B0H16DRAFT_1459654 [Mycena metata]|uniref:Uncharacterized protein n=1 Tax=Mycena metata TaxID=1033252 RepID=A0AAD7NBM5_9AGAR|nr:hypothetical protein B0H16DRAFT_1459654 [Mycena metata]
MPVSHDWDAPKELVVETVFGPRYRSKLPVGSPKPRFNRMEAGLGQAWAVKVEYPVKVRSGAALVRELDRAIPFLWEELYAIPGNIVRHIGNVSPDARRNRAWYSVMHPATEAAILQVATNRPAFLQSRGTGILEAPRPANMWPNEDFWLTSGKSINAQESQGCMDACRRPTFFVPRVVADRATRPFPASQPRWDASNDDERHYLCLEYNGNEESFTDFSYPTGALIEAHYPPDGPIALLGHMAPTTDTQPCISHIAGPESHSYRIRVCLDPYPHLIFISHVQLESEAKRRREEGPQP